MKAYVLHSVGNLVYEDVPVPSVKSGWALLKVKASGICSSDIPRIFSNGTYHFPTIPGHEFAGEIIKVGNELDNRWIGKRVGVFPLIPCKKCTQCQKRKYEMCSHYDYLGSRRDGGFSEYVAVPVWNLIELPDSIPFEIAAMLEPVSVALHAVKRARIKKGYSVAVVGTGMIGICAAQWAKYNGADVVVHGRSEEKRKIIESCNLTYKSDSDVNSKGLYDVVIEAVGSDMSIAKSLGIASYGGTILLMGNPTNDIRLFKDLYWSILRKQLELKGTWNSSYKSFGLTDWKDSIDAISDCFIDVSPLITHKLKQEELKTGLDLMKEHKEPYCKVMTIWN